VTVRKGCLTNVAEDCLLTTLFFVEVWYLCYSPTEGWVTAVREGVHCATHAHGCISQWLSWWTPLPAVRFKHGSCHTAVRHATTRWVRPALVCLFCSWFIVCICRYGVVRIDSQSWACWPRHWYMTKTSQWSWPHLCTSCCLNYCIELSDRRLMVVMLLIMSCIVSFALHSVNLPVCLQMSSGMLLCLIAKVLIAYYCASVV